MAGATLAAAGEAVTGHIVVTGTVQEAIGSVAARAAWLAAVWSSPTKAALTLAGRCNTRVVERRETTNDRQLYCRGSILGHHSSSADSRTSYMIQSDERRVSK